jgi:hypothetical protein
MYTSCVLPYFSSNKLLFTDKKKILVYTKNTKIKELVKNKALGNEKKKIIITRVRTPPIYPIK